MGHQVVDLHGATQYLSNVRFIEALWTFLHACHDLVSDYDAIALGLLPGSFVADEQCLSSMCSALRDHLPSAFSCFR